MADIKLNDISNGKVGASIGEIVYFQEVHPDRPNLLEINGATYLRSSSILLETTSGSLYPEAFDKTGILGSFWTSKTSGTTSLLTGIAFGAGLFVVVGSGGDIRTSPDGEVWTARTSGTTNDFKDIVFANGLFVAVGASGTIRTSPDGITWTSRTSGTSNELISVAFGAGLYVAVETTTGAIRTSPDGIVWTFQTNTSASKKVKYLNNTFFVLVGDGGTIRTSSNGISWALRTSNTTEILNDVTFGNGVYLAVGNNGAVRISTNASLWTTSGVGSSSSLRACHFYRNSFFVTGQNFIRISNDAISWSAARSGAGVTPNAMSDNGSDIPIIVGQPGAIHKSVKMLSPGSSSANFLKEQYPIPGGVVAYMRIK